MTFPEIFIQLLGGLEVTLLVTAYAMMFAAPFAIVFGVLQYLVKGPARILVTSVIEFWRGSSVIVLLFVFYYVLPFIGLDLSAYTVAALVLGSNMGAYGSHVVRGALEILDRGQSEAALALGLSRMQALWKVEFPQAFRQMVPAFVNEVVELIKLTALVSLVALSDPTFRAKEIAQTTYNPLQIYGSLLIIYFILSYPLTILGRRLERQLAPVARSS